MPDPLSQLPWDVAQDEFGVQGADFIGVMGTLLLRAAQDEIRGYFIDSKVVAGLHGQVVVQDQMRIGPD
jgi:hypothetical protein